MLFHSFCTQEERRKFGGSAFLEFQFCRLPQDSKIKKIVSVDQIVNWQNDSLYVADENLFYQIYGSFFDDGIYNNLKSGPVDLYGINYFTPAATARIMDKIRTEQPMNHEILTGWLDNARRYNGFYILGI